MQYVASFLFRWNDHRSPQVRSIDALLGWWEVLYRVRLNVVSSSKKRLCLWVVVLLAIGLHFFSDYFACNCSLPGGWHFLSTLPFFFWSNGFADHGNTKKHGAVQRTSGKTMSARPVFSLHFPNLTRMLTAGGAVRLSLLLAICK